jgi:hypothetical protein
MGLEHGRTPTHTTSFGAAATAVVSARPRRVIGLVAVNRNATARYIQLFDQASGAPVGGTNLKLQFLIPAGGQVAIGSDVLDTAGAYFATGVVFGFSTTAGTYVAATAGESDLTIAHLSP